MRAPILLLLAVLAAGCRHAPTSTPPVTRTDPVATLHEQLRAGSFELGVAAQSLAQAYQGAGRARGEAVKSRDIASALADAADYLDSAGSSVSDYIVEPPPVDVVRQKFKQYQALRSDSLKAATDALEDLQQAAGIVDDLPEGLPPKVQAALDDLSDKLDQADEDLRSAIQALGGTPPVQPEDSTASEVLPAK